MLKKLTLISLLLLYISYAQDNYTAYNNIAYDNKSKTQTLDIYIPKQKTIKPTPLIIYIHGGAFKFGDKKDRYLPSILPQAIKRGYSIASINYRLADEAYWPAQIYDIKTAISFLYKNSMKYSIQKENIALWGTSAGAFLASLAGTSINSNFLTPQGTQKVDIKAVVDWFGPINFATIEKEYNELDTSFKINNMLSIAQLLLLGKTISDVPALVKEANPVTYLDRNDPAFYIQHGNKDNIIPIKQSQYFYNQLIKVLNKNDVKFDSLNNAKHGGYSFRTTSNINKIIDFLDDYLK